jgi:hypothetical protein
MTCPEKLCHVRCNVGEESCNARQFDTLSLLPQAASIHHHISYIIIILSTLYVCPTKDCSPNPKLGAEFHVNLVAFLQFGPNLE